MTRNINDPRDERKRFEDINNKNFRKFQQALKQAEAKNESLHGKVYDRKMGRFVFPREVSDIKNCGKLIEKDFFIKNGSLFSRIEAELELFNDLHRIHYGRKLNKQSSNLICIESRQRKESELILPGTFASTASSPLKMFPRKPATASKLVQD